MDVGSCEAIYCSRPDCPVLKHTICFPGHFHQGFQLAGLLQHGQWRCHPPGPQGERREEEVEGNLLSDLSHCRFCLYYPLLPHPLSQTQETLPCTFLSFFLTKFGNSNGPELSKPLSFPVVSGIPLCLSLDLRGFISLGSILGDMNPEMSCGIVS